MTDLHFPVAGLHFDNAGNDARGGGVLTLAPEAFVLSTSMLLSKPTLSNSYSQPVVHYCPVKIPDMIVNVDPCVVFKASEISDLSAEATTMCYCSISQNFFKFIP